MFPRSLAHCLLIGLCSALVGCGWVNGKPAPKVVVAPISPVAQARKDLLDIAKKIEEPSALEAIETYVKEFENPEKGWTWSDLDDYILRGNFSIQTKTAYEKWRAATIKEGSKR